MVFKSCVMIGPEVICSLGRMCDSPLDLYQKSQKVIELLRILFTLPGSYGNSHVEQRPGVPERPEDVLGASSRHSSSGGGPGSLGGSIRGAPPSNRSAPSPSNGIASDPHERQGLRVPPGPARPVLPLPPTPNGRNPPFYAV